MGEGSVADPRGIHVTCGSCGQTNRLRYETLDRATRCGKCQALLSAVAAPVAVNEASVFDAMLASSALPIVVDFWAPWCGPCRAMAPEFERVSRATAGKWLAVKVDTDRVPELGQRYRIMSIPTVAVFRGGQEKARRSGAIAASEIQQLMNTAAS